MLYLQLKIEVENLSPTRHLAEVGLEMRELRQSRLSYLFALRVNLGAFLYFGAKSDEYMRLESKIISKMMS